VRIEKYSNSRFYCNPTATCFYPLPVNAAFSFAAAFFSSSKLSIVCTVLGDSPSSSIRVAKVCLASWIRLDGNPACAMSLSKERRKFLGSIGLPLAWQKTNP
jgi:hypothetical protein